MVKVAVLGASGGIGQPLSLLLKSNPSITELALYDVVNSPGVAADISHISTPAKVTGHLPVNDGLKHALHAAHLVIIPAGIPRKPGMTRDDLFKVNAGIVQTLLRGVAEHAPRAFVCIISNPVNSTVPIAAEVLKAAGVFDPRRLFGVTSLDVVRAETFVQPYSGCRDPAAARVPVVGGHSGDTIVPLFSLAEPKLEIPREEYEAVVKRVQFGGDEVVKAKDGGGSATLSMAYAGARFAKNIIDAITTSPATPIVENTYVYLPGVPGGEEIAKTLGVEFFSVPVELGTDGAHRAINILGNITEQEKSLLDVAVAGLKGNIAKGVEFAVAKL